MLNHENSAASVQNEAIEKAWENAEKLRKSGEVLDSETELYRHFDAWGRLLYVGISCSTVIRLGQHMQDCDWRRLVCTITIERWDTRELARLAERQAIQFEEPYFNKALSVVHKKWRRPNPKKHRELCGDRRCGGCLPVPDSAYTRVEITKP